MTRDRLRLQAVGAGSWSSLTDLWNPEPTPARHVLCPWATLDPRDVCLSRKPWGGKGVLVEDKRRLEGGRLAAGVSDQLGQMSVRTAGTAHPSS